MAGNEIEVSHKVCFICWLVLMAWHLSLGNGGSGNSSSDFVGEVLWACAECGTAICPAEKAPKAGRKRRSKTAKVPLRALDTPMCAICHRTQSEVEASGSRLEKHHRVPLADGGDDSTVKLLILCRECHEAWHKAHQKVRDELREQAVAEALPLAEAQPQRGLWQRLKNLLGL